MTRALRPTDVLAGRYRLDDLIGENDGGRFWRAHDTLLDRQVAVHVIPAADRRSDLLLDAARRSTVVADRRVLRVLDAAVVDDRCYVVNEWGTGVSLDRLVDAGPLAPRHAAWVVAEVAQALVPAHERGGSHGRLVPENVLVDRHGGVRLIGLGVDAALHDRPFDRPATDVTDLAGLLYCALTGTWAGESPSAVRAAPRERGQVLRPRRVRAGVPRPLDELCDAVLHPPAGARRAETGPGLGTAAGVAERLRRFVGPDGDVADALAATLPPVRERPGRHLAPAPRTPAPTDPPADPPTDRPTDPPTVRSAPTAAPERAPAPTPEPTPEPGPTTASPAARPVADVPTEAALPAVGSSRVAPPAPADLPDLPERPLFAPDPPGGARRRPTPVAAPVPADDPGSDWPWSSREEDGAARSAAGSGLLPAVEDDVPGRRSLRLALVLTLLLLLVLGGTVVYNLGRGRTPLGAVPEPSTSSSPRPAPTPDPEPLTGLVATDLDPQGGDGAERPEDTGLAVDGDPATGWRTSVYFQQLGPTGLKTGLGLVVDLGGEREVSEVDVTFGGEPTSATLYLSDTAPTAVAGLTPAAGADGAGPEATLTPEEPTSARYVVVWLTALPAVAGGFQGDVREIRVLGA